MYGGVDRVVTLSGHNKPIMIEKSLNIEIYNGGYHNFLLQEPTLKVRVITEQWTLINTKTNKLLRCSFLEEVQYVVPVTRHRAS